MQHAKRTQALNDLPPYQPELVRAVAREVRELDKDVSNILAPYNGSFNPSSSPTIACSLLVDHLCMRRNKRCLLAYHRVRLDKLEELCWSGEDVLDARIGQLESRNAHGTGELEGRSLSSLSPDEEEYVRQYNDLLASCNGQWTDIDLTGALEPPKDLFIDVRVLKDAGEIQTEYGWVGFGQMPSKLVCSLSQCNQVDKEQSVLCQTRRCWAVDCTGISPETWLRRSKYRPCYWLSGLLCYIKEVLACVR